MVQTAIHRPEGERHLRRAHPITSAPHGAAAARAGRRLACAALLAVLTGPSAAWAQSGGQTAPEAAPSPSPEAPPAQAPPTPVSPVTVEGTSREVLEKQARSFIDSYAAPAARLDQFARWYGPACVIVTGLVPDQAAPIKARVEQVAKAVGAPVAPSKCSPNIQIVFSNDAQHELDAIAAKNPGILGYDGAKTITRPIQAWYGTRALGKPPPPDRGLKTQGAYVAPLSCNCMASGRLNFSAQLERYRDRLGATPAEQGRPIAVGRRCVDTRSPDCPHGTFLNVLVIVDAAHMGDVGLDLTSDYLAMLALSQPRSLDGCMALSSVMDLYAKDCAGRDPPAGLTPADMAYLTSLYAADLTVAKRDEQSDIAGRMVKILAPAKPPAR